MADPTRGSIDLSFVSEDVRTQLAHSREILNQVKSLAELLPEISNDKVRGEIQKSITELLNIASGLVSNATSTSANTELTIISSKKRP